MSRRSPRLVKHEYESALSTPATLSVKEVSESLNVITSYMDKIKSCYTMEEKEYIYASVMEYVYTHPRILAAFPNVRRILLDNAQKMQSKSKRLEDITNKVLELIA